MALEDFVPEGGEVESFLDDSEDSDDEEDSQEDRWEFIVVART